MLARLTLVCLALVVSLVSVHQAPIALEASLPTPVAADSTPMPAG